VGKLTISVKIVSLLTEFELRWFALLLKYLSRTWYFPRSTRIQTRAAVCFHVPTGPCPRHGLVSPSGVRLAVDHNHRPSPSVHTAALRAGPALQRCVDVPACMHARWQTDDPSPELIRNVGGTGRDRLTWCCGTSIRCRTCRVLISSKFLLKNLAPPGARPGLVTVRATVRVHVVADRLFASSSRMCRYFCRQPVTKKNF